ncbi:MAG: hypothetical protein RCG15_03000 [Candidatus Rickettsia vulgarisii]
MTGDLTFNAPGTFNLGDGQSLAGNIKGNGNFNLLGDGTIDGDIGVPDSLNAINIPANKTLTASGGNINVNNINFDTNVGRVLKLTNPNGV